MDMNNIRAFIIIALSLVCSACGDNKRHETAICALMDISGTYADEKPNVIKIVKAGIVPQMSPGDSLFFITIDSNSYDEQNLKASLTLDYTPSKANRQKLAFATKLDEYAKTGGQARFTDISGAMMLCTDYLKKTGSGNQSIIVFSDMREELKEGFKRNFDENEFEGINIAAMNVIKLSPDSSDPKLYRDRLASWEKRVLKSGANAWEVIIDPLKIPEYIERLR